MSIEPKIKETSTADVVGGKGRGDRPTSTTDLAKDFERIEPAGATDDAATFRHSRARHGPVQWANARLAL